MVIDIENVTIVIENKLYSPERPEQALAQEKAFQSDVQYSGRDLIFVFLTPSGQQALNTRFIPISLIEKGVDKRRCIKAHFNIYAGDIVTNCMFHIFSAD